MYFGKDVLGCTPPFIDLNFNLSILIAPLSNLLRFVLPSKHLARCNWPLPKRAGGWGRINTAMALGIVWRDRIQSINQLIDRSIDQSINQTIKHKCFGSTIVV